MQDFKFQGVMLAGDDISLNSTNAIMSYDRAFAEDPPAVFDVGLIELNIASGSWKRTVED